MSYSKYCSQVIMTHVLTVLSACVKHYILVWLCHRFMAFGWGGHGPPAPPIPTPINIFQAQCLTSLPDFGGYWLLLLLGADGLCQQWSALIALIWLVKFGAAVKTRILLGGYKAANFDIIPTLTFKMGQVGGHSAELQVKYFYFCKFNDCYSSLISRLELPHRHTEHCMHATH